MDINRPSKALIEASEAAKKKVEEITKMAAASTKPITDLLEIQHQQGEDMRKGLQESLAFEAKQTAQPFKMVKLLEKIDKAQTPKWVNYGILFLTAIILFLAILTALHIHINISDILSSISKP
jgi:hypothetical protein